MKALFAVAAMALVCGPVSRAQDLRINVLSKYHPVVLQVTPSGTQAVVVVAANRRFVLQPDLAHATATIREAAGQLAIDVDGEHILAKSLRAAGRTDAADFLLVVPGKVSRRYFGVLTVVSKDGELQVVVAMNLETAVASVVQAETEPQTPIEALKAQAIVTRSYFVAARGRHYGFDFCDLAHCQVLGGQPAPGSPAERAALATRGLVLTYRNQPFAAMFTRSCGGRTRTPAQDGLPSNVYPYFAVECDYCRTHPYRWTRRVSSDTAQLLSKGESGRLALCRREGWNAIPSDDYTARKAGGEVVLNGEGQGHGIGLCQRGAEAMAESGATYREILAHYFPNTSIGQFAAANRTTEGVAER